MQQREQSESEIDDDECNASESTPEEDEEDDLDEVEWQIAEQARKLQDAINADSQGVLDIEAPGTDEIELEAL